jgi:hypothetical protein
MTVLSDETIRDPARHPGAVRYADMQESSLRENSEKRRYRLRPHSRAEPVIHALSAPKRHGQVEINTAAGSIL